MAKKTTSKKVIDYDPLAWLDEAGDQTEKKASASEKKASKKSVVKKAVKKKPAVKKTTVKKSSARKTTKSRSVSETEQSVATKPSSEQGGMDDGLFSDPSIESEAASEKAENSSEGYGFFDDIEETSTQPVEISNESDVINLGVELTIRSVSNLKSLIDDNLHKGLEIKLDAGDLQKIDSAGLQLIYSLNKTLGKTSQTIHWVTTDSIINDAAQMIGMPNLLGSDQGDNSYGFFDTEEMPKTEQVEEAGFGFF